MLRAWLTAKFAGTKRTRHFGTLKSKPGIGESRVGNKVTAFILAGVGLGGWVFWIKEHTRPQASPSPHPNFVPLTNWGSWDSGEPEPLLVSEWEGEGAVAVWPAEDAGAGMMKGDVSELCPSDLHQPAPASGVLLSSPSELPWKQSVAKPRTFPEAVEIACVMDRRARAADRQRPAP